MIDRQALRRLYLEWVNDYLTIEKFAEHHALHVDEAEQLVKVAQSCFENNHPEE